MGEFTIEGEHEIELLPTTARRATAKRVPAERAVLGTSVSSSSWPVLNVDAYGGVAPYSYLAGNGRVWWLAMTEGPQNWGLYLYTTVPGVDETPRFVGERLSDARGEMHLEPRTIDGQKVFVLILNRYLANGRKLTIQRLRVTDFVPVKG